MMRKKDFLIFTNILTCVWISTLLASPMTNNKLNGVNEEKIVLVDSINKMKKINHKDSIKELLIKQTEKYIFTTFPKTNKLVPTAIVENALEHNVDILFMMAQTQIETSFGNAGAGRETSRRSLFGVAKRKYNNYNEAIIDYIKILKKSYLVKGKTEQHLMRKYTTTNGTRYAGNPNYENELKNAYTNINKKTNIKKLQTEYIKYIQ